jgi:hypothetical protein
MALSLTRPSSLASRRATPSTHRRNLLAAPPRATNNNNNSSDGGLVGMFDAVGAALTRALFSPPSADNANVSAGSNGFSGRLPARHGAARRPFAGDAGVFKQSNKTVAKNNNTITTSGGAAAASMASADEDATHGSGLSDYLGGALGRVFGGQAGMMDDDDAPTTGSGWTGEGAHRRHRRPGTGGGF